MDEQMVARQAAKTVEHHFVRTLIEEFRFAPRVAEAVLAEAQESLLEGRKEPGTGQIRVILTQRRAGHGQPLNKTASKEVLWTIHAGAEDQQVLVTHGRKALRQVRIVRLLDEAIDQGAAATQEDLAMSLNVGLRTIRRDCKELAAQGVYLPTRGNLQGIGRGQTHKALIVGRWLGGETYDQLMLSTRHSLTCIRRYIQSFVRVVELYEQAFSVGQIARLVEHSQALVQEYLAVYHQNDSPACRERLAEHLTRLSKAAGETSQPKRGAL
jgi:hypothetical protein